MLFDFNRETGRSRTIENLGNDQYTQNIKDLQLYYDPEEKGIYPIPISWWDYQHEDVYLLVTKRNPRKGVFKF